MRRHMIDVRSIPPSLMDPDPADGTWLGMLLVMFAIGRRRSSFALLPRVVGCGDRLSTTNRYLPTKLYCILLD